MVTSTKRLVLCFFCLAQDSVRAFSLSRGFADVYARQLALPNTQPVGRGCQLICDFGNCAECVTGFGHVRSS